MKKNLLFTVIMPWLAITAKAQLSAGLNAGYTNNEYYPNISNYDGAYYKRGEGYMFSVPLQWSLQGLFALETEPGLVEKTFSLWQTAQTAQSTHLTSRYNYL